MFRGSLEAQEPDGANGAASGCFDAPGELPGWEGCALQDFMEMGIVGVEGSGQSGDVGDRGTEIEHAGSVGPKPRTFNPNPYGIFSHNSEDGDMDEWAYRRQFRDRVAEYRSKHHLTPDEMAMRLGLKPSTYTGYLYKKKGKPGVEVLQLAAGLFGCSVLEFMDDPGAPVAGVGAESFSEASEQERVILRAIAEDLVKLTPDQRRAMFDAWSAIVRGYLTK